MAKKIKVFGGEIDATPEFMEWLKDYDNAQYVALTNGDVEELEVQEEVKETKTKTTKKK